ncbi:MAG: DUF2809 domain-containing protein [Bacteroidia bacterium]|nr:DUF2809 domain-containing protein [Bacteroidia bacterium]
MMVFFMFRVIFTNPLKWLLYEFVFSYIIKFSQLFQVGWINSLRTTVLGALVLGSGFLWIDLVCYFTGIVLAFAIDRFLLNSFYIPNKVVA